MIENGRIRIYPAQQEQMESIISAEMADESAKVRV